MALWPKLKGSFHIRYVIWMFRLVEPEECCKMGQMFFLIIYQILYPNDENDLRTWYGLMLSPTETSIAMCVFFVLLCQLL